MKSGPKEDQIRALKAARSGRQPAPRRAALDKAMRSIKTAVDKPRKAKSKGRAPFPKVSPG